ncbi:MAG: gpW family head-tail joining protein [Enterobacteriaceae bacterium]
MITCGMFSGLSREQLLDALKNAQAAYLDLCTGKKGVSFSYASGDGSKSVSYQQTDMVALRNLITELQHSLGICSQRRRPIRFRHG